jgi:hypothetical protein
MTAPALIAETQALRERVRVLEEENARLQQELDRTWRERNRAVAENKAWRDVMYVPGLPLRAARVDEFGPGEGEEVHLPALTPQRLTDLLDMIAQARAALSGE